VLFLQQLVNKKTFKNLKKKCKIIKKPHVNTMIYIIMKNDKKKLKNPEKYKGLM